MFNLFRKSFILDNEDMFSKYPTNNEVITKIIDKLEDVEFLDYKNLIFKYNGHKYKAYIRETRGYYYISCREVKK